MKVTGLAKGFVQANRRDEAVVAIEQKAGDF
jgi:hypothetical protein